jgi:hypothetical protein
MHLIHVRHVDHRIHLAQFDVGAGLFMRFAQCADRRGFAQLHEAGGQGPGVVARLDGAAAQQDAALPYRHGAHHHQRIAVVHRAAVLAHVAHLAVAGRREPGGA